VLSELARLEMALDPGERGMERALEAIVRAQALGTLARSVGAETVDVATIRARLLSTGVGVLVYLPALERTHVFALDARAIAHGYAPARHAIVRANDDLASDLSTTPRGLSQAELEARSARIARACRALGGDLVPAEIEPLLRNWHTVLVVGAELMGDVPFEVLTMRSGRALGIERATGYLPSLPFAAWLSAREREVRSELELFLLAAPAFPPDDERPVLALDFTAADEEGLLAPFASTAARSLRGEHASATALLSASPSLTRVLAVLTHGIYDGARRDDGERPAGLRLSAESDRPDGIVWCSDVQRARAPRLVELIACGSSRGPSRMGDDTGAHLGSAFLGVGARAVVLSPNEIAYASSLRLLARVHDRMRRHFESPAEALRAARAELASEAATADPYYWGLVRVIGLAHESVFDARTDALAPEHSGRSAWIVAACGALLVAAGFVARRARTASVSS
jgi:hypothetical protein